MRIRILIPALFFAGFSLTLAPGCTTKPDDTTLKAKVESALNNPAILVEVKDATVTISGSVATETDKMEADSVARSVEAVEIVTNLLTVTPSQDEAFELNYADDSTLLKGLAIVKKNFRSVSATVQGGIITLSGTVDKDEIPRVMQAVMALKPKDVVDKFTVK